MSREDELRGAWQHMHRVFLSREAHDRFHDACAAIGVPHPGSLKTLMELDADDPPSMREVAAWMNCDASYVTSLVDALEELGYVERTVSPADRRVKLVRLTEAGAAAKERAFEVMSVPPKALEALNATEARTLARLMVKVVEADPDLGH
jgi:DNA-binding MarR family transcriptional regulator